MIARRLSTSTVAAKPAHPAVIPDRRSGSSDPHDRQRAEEGGVDRRQPGRDHQPPSHRHRARHSHRLQHALELLAVALEAIGQDVEFPAVVAAGLDHAVFL